MVITDAAKLKAISCDCHSVILSAHERSLVPASLATCS
jgi:hypothetical protein